MHHTNRRILYSLFYSVPSGISVCWIVHKPLCVRRVKATRWSAGRVESCGTGRCSSSATSTSTTSSRRCCAAMPDSSAGAVGSRRATAQRPVRRTTATAASRCAAGTAAPSTTTTSSHSTFCLLESPRQPSTRTPADPLARGSSDSTLKFPTVLWSPKSWTLDTSCYYLELHA